MQSKAVLGCAWGDEAKAKIVDVLAINADIIVRFQGGNNAGHTIVINNKKYVFHLVPSGILYPEKICVLGSGVVIDPFALMDEIEKLETQGISFENRFFIDPRAQIVLPIHKELDGKNEKDNKQTKIGTTKRGIGPSYADAVARIGIRFGDLFDEDFLSNRLQNILISHKFSLDRLEKIKSNLLQIAVKMRNFQRQIPYFLNNTKDKTILFEGAQGTLLDVYFGTYPFVTSSHTMSGGISVGSGFSKKIDKTVGVFKSYYTRVGEGPFPTELFDEIGKKIREQGNEYGATTGRPRRCGWFDAVAGNFTAMINDIDEISLTLLDVFSGFEKLKICTAYKLDGKITKEFPYNSEQLKKIVPQYIELPGWKEDITKITEYEKLPKNAKNYVKKVENLLGKKITIISVGPNRNQTIFRDV